MNALRDFVSRYANRGPCCCGKCIDAPPNPEGKQPEGHTVDVHFFKVAARAEEGELPHLAAQLRALLKESNKGEYADVDPLDGKEHNFMELGGWIGDQGLALTLMGLGGRLGLWKVLTPRSVLGPIISNNPDMANRLAGMGMVSIIANREALETYQGH